MTAAADPGSAASSLKIGSAGQAGNPSRLESGGRIVFLPWLPPRSLCRALTSAIAERLEAAVVGALGPSAVGYVAGR